MQNSSGIFTLSLNKSDILVASSYLYTSGGWFCRCTQLSLHNRLRWYFLLDIQIDDITGEEKSVACGKGAQTYSFTELTLAYNFRKTASFIDPTQMMYEMSVSCKKKNSLNT